MDTSNPPLACDCARALCLIMEASRWLSQSVDLTPYIISKVQIDGIMQIAVWDYSKIIQHRQGCRGEEMLDAWYSSSGNPKIAQRSVFQPRDSDTNIKHHTTVWTHGQNTVQMFCWRVDMSGVVAAMVRCDIYGELCASLREGFCTASTSWYLDYWLVFLPRSIVLLSVWGAHSVQ